MFCKYCGSEIADNSKFCIKCGKPVETSPGESKSVQRKRNKKPVIIGITSLVIIFICLGAAFWYCTGVTSITKSVEAGSVITTKDLIIPRIKSSSVTIKGKIDTDVLGETTISYTVKTGVLKRTSETVITVVDTTSPIITGPESLKIIAGEKFDPAQYYDVDDFEENLKNNIVVENEIDTKKEGDKPLKMTVKDSSGNVGSKTVTVKVLKLSRNEEIAFKAVNQFLADGKSKSDIPYSVDVMKTVGANNGVDYYVAFSSSELYAIDKSGKVYEFMASDAGGSGVYSLLIYAVETEGVSVATSKFK